MTPRRAFAIFASFEALAVAAWLVPASIYVVRWPAPGPSRVAMFASPSVAVLSVIVAAIAAVVVIVASKHGRAASIVSPLCLLWLWAMPYLPWLPERIPMLLVLAGPIRWVIAAIAAGAVIVRALRFTAGVQGAARQRDRIERHARPVVLLASLVLYAAFGLNNAREVGPGGDEPHYLIIAQSLLADGDLKIENNHQRRDYRAYFSAELRPDYMKRGLDGQIYSIHAPGLPLLIAPAYAAAGYRGVILLMCLAAALTALAIFDLAAGLVGTRTALLAWMATCMTVPFIPHSWLIFPEIPGALVVAWGAFWLWNPREKRPGRWFWRGLAFATLPWLHTKFIIFVAIFGLAFMWKFAAEGRSRGHGDGPPNGGLYARRWKAMAAFALPVAISLAAWLAFFYVIYGSINPEAPYGNYPEIYVLAKNIPRGLLGLIADQKFGLLFYSPIYALAIAGCWFALRCSDARFLVAVLLLMTAAYVGNTTRLYMWWGGTSAPARFLVPLVPCLAPMIAIGVSRLKGRLVGTLAAGALGVSMLVALAGSIWPGRLLLFSDPRGYARLLETIQTGAPLTFVLPTFTNENWVSPIGDLFPWLVAAGVAVAAMAIAARSPRIDQLWLGAIGGLALLLTAGVAAARPTAAARSALARSGAMDLLWQYDDEHRQPFSYDSMKTVDRSQLNALDVITFDAYPAEQFALPQGSYEARVWFLGSTQRSGDIVVSSRGRIEIARGNGPFSNPAVVPFSLPVAVGRLSVAASDEELAARIARIEIAPTTIVPLAAREAQSTRAFEAIPDRPSAFVAYLDDHEYPEGSSFWTRALEAATVFVAPGPHSQIVLTLTLGPREGEVIVNGAGTNQRVRVERHQTAEVQLTVPHGARLVPVTIQSPTTFRPSDVDPRSDDDRNLGCQVRVDVR